MKQIQISLLFFFAGITIALAQAPNYSWLAGTWTGAGFGGTMEEIWSTPDKIGVMIGMFRHIDQDGQPTFYEFWTLTEQGLKLKHFDPEMIGWEEMDKFIEFPMKKSTESFLTLEGLIYEKLDNLHVRITLDLEENGKVHQEVFTLTRVR